MKRNMKREDGRDLLRDQALGRSLIFKAMRIASDLHTIHQHVSASLSRLPSEKPTEPWTVVLPIANLPDPSSFSADEVAVAMIGKPSIASDILDLEAIHKSSIAILKEYANSRQKLLEKIPASNFEGNKGSVELAPEQILKLRPLMIEANSLIEQLAARSKGDSDFARATLDEVSETLKKTHKLDIKLAWRVQK